MNPLPWQADEERGELLGLVYVVFGGTSHHSTTAFKQPDGRWLICAWWKYWQTNDDFLSHCFFSDNPVPIPPYVPPTTGTYPWCPYEYPTYLTCDASVIGGSECGCIDRDRIDLYWDDTVGPLGGWKGQFSGCARPVTVKFWGEKEIGSPATWRYHIYGIDGGTMGIGFFVCGEVLSPIVTTLIGRPCDGATIQLDLSMPS